MYVDESTQDIDYISSTEIKWKDGKDIRMKKVEKKQKHKRKGKDRVIVKEEKVPSFFWIFKDHYNPCEDDEEEDEDEHKNDDELSDENLFYSASDVVQCLRDEYFKFLLPAITGVRIESFETPEELKQMDKKELETKKKNEEGAKGENT